MINRILDNSNIWEKLKENEPILRSKNIFNFLSKAFSGMLLCTHRELLLKLTGVDSGIDTHLHGSYDSSWLRIACH